MDASIFDSAMSLTSSPRLFRLMIKKDKNKYFNEVNIGCDTASEQEVVETTCNELLTGDWAKKCLQVIDPTPYIDSCILDLCMDNTEETKMEILEPFLDECLDAEEEDEKICLVDQNEIETQPGLLLTTIPKWHPTYMLEAEIKIETTGSQTALLLTQDQTVPRVYIGCFIDKNNRDLPHYQSERVLYYLVYI